MILEKIRSTVESFNLNISEKEVLNHLKNTKRWPQSYPWGQSSVEIINNIGTQSANFFKAHVYTNQCYLDFDKWYRYYDLGYTTIISNVFDLNDGLRELSHKLTDMTGMLLNGNFYFSKPGQIASFNGHTHNYNVIVKQIYGESKWVVGDKDINLKPQKALIVPSMSVHKVVTKMNKKLSLTINID
tara:strand:+ start:92 stop:649 length:558 start_codon:yes stop_codon:yes gene_type:complete